MAGALYLGTSGFAYDEWRGAFYPDGLKQAEMLAHYAGRFPSVEVNYTFRRFPSETTLRAWRERTPDGFRFALKANQRITHSLRLAGAEGAVSSFAERVRGLGDRLGPVLFQCPPSLRYDRPLIESFLADLPRGLPAAMEFRHPSWEEARPTLAERGVAWCVADTDERPAGAVAAEPFAYLRLRREAYADDDLRRWAGRIRAALEEGRDVYCYLKHERDAPARAERLAALVAALGP